MTSRPMTRALAPLALALFACTSLAIPALARAQDPDLSVHPRAKDVRSIAITATDRVLQPADVATVHIGYELFGPDQPTAYTSAAKASNAIIDAIRSAGVPRDTIESEQQTIAPMESFQLNQLTLAERSSHAFVAQQSWIVRSAADDAARILDIAGKAGANKSGQIDWSLKDPNAASAEAAAKALQRARAQAQAMASGLNVKLGQLLYASNEVASIAHSPRAMMMAADAKRRAAPPARHQRPPDRDLRHRLRRLRHRVTHFMPVFDYRDPRPTPEAEQLYTAWLDALDDGFTRETTYEARSEIVRDALQHLLHPNVLTAISLSSQTALAALDPRNITLEPEYYGDMDPARYYPRKPLIWLWLQFDSQPARRQPVARRAPSRDARPPPLRAHRPARPHLPARRNSATATTSRSATTAGFTATSCSTTAAASPSTTAPASATTPTSTRTRTISSTSATSPTSAPRSAPAPASPITPPCSPAPRSAPTPCSAL